MEEIADQGKNMDGVFEFLKAHYQYVLIVAGLIFFIGALRDWKWVYDATSGDRIRHAFIFEIWGEKGYRVFIGICGLILVLCGVVFLFLDKR